MKQKERTITALAYTQLGYCDENEVMLTLMEYAARWGGNKLVMSVEMLDPTLFRGEGDSNASGFPTKS